MSSTTTTEIAATGEAASGDLTRAGVGGTRRGPSRASRRRRPLLRLVASLTALVVLYGLWGVAEVELAARRGPDRPADVAVVFGAAQYDGTPSGALAGRLERAAELYRDGMVRFVLVTGGNQPGDRTTEGMVGFLYLRDLGVPEEALLVENSSTNSWEQLLATELILGERGLDSTLLVSDPAHSRRLSAIAEELGVRAQTAPTHAPVGWRDRVREGAGVAIGRLIGFRRLSRLADRRPVGTVVRASA